MAITNDSPSPSSPILARIDDLQKVVALIQREGAHVVVDSLPGMGKSVFVRQLLLPENREALGLGQDYLVVLLDGRCFVGLSPGHVWGAVVQALERARADRSSQVCEARSDLAIDRDQLRRALYRFSGYRPVLILDHCSSLCERLGTCVCGDLLRRSPRGTTFVTVPGSLAAIPDVEAICLSSVPLPLLPVPPEQACRFLVDALRPWAANRDLQYTLLGRIVDWVGGIPYLLHAVSGLLCHQLAQGTSPDRDTVAGGRLLDLELGRWLYQQCRTIARPFFDRWWDALSKQDGMALLLVDELQRRGLDLPKAIGKVSRQGAIARIDNRYVVQPLLWKEYLSERSKAIYARPFSIDLTVPQVVHVNGKRCELSFEQANLFLDLLLQWDKEVYYDVLYKDLRPTHWSVAEGAADSIARFKMHTVDLVMDDLRAALGVGPEIIARSPPSAALRLEGYRLAVEPEYLDPNMDSVRANGRGPMPG